METVKSYLQNKWVLPAAALVLGIALGLLYAWVIDPVEWVDGVPAQLREDLRADYLRMVIESYGVDEDGETALRRYGELGEFGGDTLQYVGANPEHLDADTIQNFGALVELAGGAEPVEEGGEETPSAPGGRTASWVLPVCGATLLLGVLLAAVLVLRGRLPEKVDIFRILPTRERDEEFEDTALHVDEAREEPRENLGTFRTSYALGDDTYDDAFSIESPGGDFLGECGVGFGDIIGVGDPKKVSAFEVWLFDKNDIQTVTKVIMSQYTYNDEASRGRMASKGDPVLAESGGVVALETASLIVEARIVDFSYGEGPLPSESYFDRMTIELTAYPRIGKTRPGARFA